MSTATLGPGGEIVLPSSVRRALGLRKGDQILIEEVADGAVVLKPQRPTLRQLRGSVPVSGPQDFDAIRRDVLGPS